MRLKRKICAVQLHPVNLVIDKAMMIKLSMIYATRENLH